MEGVISNSLDMVAKKGFKSIALPAMGTGNLCFPRNVVADTMFKVVMDFSKANSGSSLKEVVFVLYTGDQQTIDVSPCSSHCEVKIDLGHKFLEITTSR